MCDVEELIWLENPFNYDYIREGMGASCSRDTKSRKGNKIIGFEISKKKGKGIYVYNRRFWWLNKHDKDCEEPYKDYQNGISRPSGAIAPKDIIIPENIRVLKVYEIERAVSEYKYKNRINDADYIREYTKAKDGNYPFMAIMKGTKYAYFEWDMGHMNFDLKEKAKNELNAIIHKFLKQFDKAYCNLIFLKSSIFGCGKNYGLTPHMRLYECRILAKQLKEIINDRSNWEDIMEKWSH